MDKTGVSILLASRLEFLWKTSGEVQRQFARIHSYKTVLNTTSRCNIPLATLQTTEGGNNCGSTSMFSQHMIQGNDL